MKKLTARSRGIIYLALCISGLVIATAVLYFIAARRQDGVDGQTAWVVIGIAAAALLAIGFVFYMRARRSRYTRNLEPPYYAAYEHVSDILQASPLGIAERRETLSDVLDLLWQAQRDGRPASDVTGDDVAGFMESVQASFGYRHTFLYYILNGIQYGVVYLLLLQTVLFFEGAGQVSFFEGRLDISMAALLCVVSFVVTPLIRHYVRRQKIGTVVLIPIGLMIVFIGVMELSRAYLYHIPWIRTLLDGQAALIPSWGILLLWIGAAAAAQFLKWLLRRISIKRLV